MDLEEGYGSTSDLENTASLVLKVPASPAPPKALVRQCVHCYNFTGTAQELLLHMQLFHSEMGIANIHHHLRWLNVVPEYATPECSSTERPLQQPTRPLQLMRNVPDPLELTLAPPDPALDLTLPTVKMDPEELQRVRKGKAAAEEETNSKQPALWKLK